MVTRALKGGRWESRQVVSVLACGLALALAGCSTPPSPPRPAAEAPLPAPAPAPAVTPAVATPPPLTIEAAIRRAVTCSGSIAALRASLALAERRHRAATDIADPELQLAWSEGSAESERQRWGQENSTTTQSGDQRTVSSRTTAESTSAGGVPLSSGGSLLAMTNQSLSTGRSSQSKTTTTTGVTSEDADGYQIGARFFVPNPWLIAPRLTARRAEIQAARSDVEAAEWALACEVRRLFVEVHYLTNELASVEELVRLDGRLLAAERARAEQGAATSADVLAAARRHVQAENELEASRQRLRLAERSLAALLDLDRAALRIATLEPVPVPPADLSVKRLEERALLCRADLAALHWRVAAAHGAYREAWNVRLPWVKEVAASYRSSESDVWGTDATTGSSRESGTTTESGTGQGQTDSSETPAGGGVTRTTTETRSEQAASVTRRTAGTSESEVTQTADRSESEEWRVGVAIDVPIFSWLKNHEDEVVLAEYKVAGALETEGLRLVGREIRDAWDEWEESQRQLGRQLRDVAPLVDEISRGLASLQSDPDVRADRLAAAELQLVEARRLGLAALRRHALAAVGLERALGTSLGALQPAPTPGRD